MPNKSMAHDKHSVLLTKLDKTVRSCKVVLTRFGMHERPFQNVFRCDRIEMGLHDLRPVSILFEELTWIQGRADFKMVPENILQRSLFLCGRPQVKRQNQ